MLIFRRFINAFRRSKLEKEIDREIKSHVEMHIADNISAGMSPEEARRAALIRFGNRTLTRERVAAVDAELAFDAFWRELRYAARQLRRSPAFTATALVTLILAISANVVVFSVLNALVLKPLDAPEPSGLYNIVHRQQGYDNQSYPDYLDFQTKNSTFSDMAAYRFQGAGLSTRDAAYKCWFYRVSGNYFDMLSVQPAQGRFFHASDEDGPNSAPYIVLSHDFWRRHFDSDPRVVGTTVDVDKHPFAVIGVAPPAFHGTDVFLWPDFWMPFVDSPDYQGTDFLAGRGMHNIWILGKLKPGVTPQQATDNLNAIARELARQNREDDGLDARLVKPGLMGDMFGDPARSFLGGIMVLAFLVLLAACVNLASLFAARTADRSRELAIRLAIGSSRWTVLRQLLAEAVLLSVLGGALGTIFSTALLNTLTRWQPFFEFPIHVTVSPDPKVYLVALLLSIGSGIGWGLVPLRQIWATDSGQVMKSGGAGTSVFRRFTLRDLLLGAQITICTLLVTSSFVALRGMQRSLHAALGFQPQAVVLAETDLQFGGHSDAECTRLQKRMLQEVARLPGVTAGIIDETPLGTGGSSTLIYRMGTNDFRGSNSAFAAKYFSISPGYLEAAGTHLLMGRDFTSYDDAKAPNVAIVNETFAQRMFGNTFPLGLRFALGEKYSYQIVGLVENGKYESLTETPWAAVFFPLEQNPESDTSLIVRSPLPPAEIVPQLHRVLAQIDPSLPFVVHTWTDALAFVQFPARVATAALGVMGLLAAMLAVTGVFGMAMYSVSKRMREFGIRVAVGAQPAQLMRSALSRPLILLLGGSAAGLLLGVIASQLLAQVVYEATPRDPLVFAGVMVTMALLGLLATWLPARRALRIHPASLLRGE